MKVEDVELMIACTVSGIGYWPQNVTNGNVLLGNVAMPGQKVALLNKKGAPEIEFSFVKEGADELDTPFVERPPYKVTSELILTVAEKPTATYLIEARDSQEPSGEAGALMVSDTPLADGPGLAPASALKWSIDARLREDGEKLDIYILNYNELTGCSYVPLNQQDSQSFSANRIESGEVFNVYNETGKDAYVSINPRSANEPAPPPLTDDHVNKPAKRHKPKHPMVKIPNNGSIAFVAPAVDGHKLYEVVASVQDGGNVITEITVGQIIVQGTPPDEDKKKPFSPLAWFG